MIGWNWILLCFLRDVDLLRICSQLSNEGYSVIPFLYIQTHYTCSGPNPIHWISAGRSSYIFFSTCCYGSGTYQQVYLSLHAGSPPLFKVEPILPRPHIHLVSDPPYPRGSHLKNTLYNLLVPVRNEPECLAEKPYWWASGSSSPKSIPGATPPLFLANFGPK